MDPILTPSLPGRLCRSRTNYTAGMGDYPAVAFPLLFVGVFFTSVFRFLGNSLHLNSPDRLPLPPAPSRPSFEPGRGRKQ